MEEPGSEEIPREEVGSKESMENLRFGVVVLDPCAWGRLLVESKHLLKCRDQRLCLLAKIGLDAQVDRGDGGHRSRAWSRARTGKLGLSPRPLHPSPAMDVKHVTDCSEDFGLVTLHVVESR